MSPAASIVSAFGLFSSAADAAPPSPVYPEVAYWLPAIVYMNPADMDTPRWVPVLAGTSWMRLLPESAMYRSPALSMLMPHGSFRYPEVAISPSHWHPACPLACPAIVYPAPAVSAVPYWAGVQEAISWMRLLPESAM